VEVVDCIVVVLEVVGVDVDMIVELVIRVLLVVG
jgi:hypothetical protein